MSMTPTKSITGAITLDQMADAFAAIERNAMSPKGERAEAALAAVTVERPWIDVKERMPQPYEEVEVLCINSTWHGEYGPEFNYLRAKAWREIPIESTPTTAPRKLIAGEAL